MALFTPPTDLDKLDEIIQGYKNALSLTSQPFAKEIEKNLRKARALRNSRNPNNIKKYFKTRQNSNTNSRKNIKPLNKNALNALHNARTRALKHPPRRAALGNNGRTRRH